MKTAIAASAGVAVIAAAISVVLIRLLTGKDNASTKKTAAQKKQRTHTTRVTTKRPQVTISLTAMPPA
jgi:hypothetical protein